MNVPHTRGDEPDDGYWYLWMVWMFPTRVGMNRPPDQRRRIIEHVPHTRGDEPEAVAQATIIQACSPHAWG